MHNLKSNREPTNALRLLASSVLDQRQRPPMNQNAGREEGRTLSRNRRVNFGVRARRETAERARAARADASAHTAHGRARARFAPSKQAEKSPQKRLRSHRRRFQQRDGTGAGEGRKSAAEAPTTRDTRLFARFVRINGHRKPRARF